MPRFRTLLRLRRENQAMRAVLGWYAVLDHWRRRGTHPKGTRVRFEMAPAHRDRGGRARAVLTKYPSRRPWSQRIAALFLREMPKPTYTVTVPRPQELPLSDNTQGDI